MSSMTGADATRGASGARAAGASAAAGCPLGSTKAAAQASSPSIAGR